MEIIIFKNHSSQVPVVKEISNRIDIKYPHRYSDGQLCLASDLELNCYKISEKKMVIVIKVFGEKYGSVDAVFPIVLVGENITCIENSLFEILSNLLSKKITECKNNSFHGGMRLFGDDFIREAISKCLVPKQYDFQE